jgi:hypothetical protein
MEQINEVRDTMTKVQHKIDARRCEIASFQSQITSLERQLLELMKTVKSWESEEARGDAGSTYKADMRDFYKSLTEEKLKQACKRLRVPYTGQTDELSLWTRLSERAYENLRTRTFDRIERIEYLLGRPGAAEEFRVAQGGEQEVRDVNFKRDSRIHEGMLRWGLDQRLEYAKDDELKLTVKMDELNTQKIHLMDR